MATTPIWRGRSSRRRILESFAPHFTRHLPCRPASRPDRNPNSARASARLRPRSSPCAAHSSPPDRGRSGRRRNSAPAGCEKYNPLTAAVGNIAKDSVRRIPALRSGIEQPPQRGLLGVIGAGRIARRRPDAPVLLADQAARRRAPRPAHSPRIRAARARAGARPSASASRSASALSMMLL